MPYTAEDARREFKPRLRRYNVLLLGARFGLSTHTTRTLLEAGSIPALHYPGHTRAYYDLEATLQAILPSPAKK